MRVRMRCSRGKHQIGEHHPEDDQQQQLPARPRPLLDDQVREPDRGQSGEGEQHGVELVQERRLDLEAPPARHHGDILTYRGRAAQGRSGFRRFPSRVDPGASADQGLDHFRLVNRPAPSRRAQLVSTDDGCRRVSRAQTRPARTGRRSCGGTGRRRRRRALGVPRLRPVPCSAAGGVSVPASRIRRRQHPPGQHAAPDPLPGRPGAPNATTGGGPAVQSQDHRDVPPDDGSAQPAARRPVAAGPDDRPEHPLAADGGRSGCSSGGTRRTRRSAA